MSRPPNSASHHRAPSYDMDNAESSSTNTHHRRASTHSAIPVSYAYGSPSIGIPSKLTSTPRGSRVGQAGSHRSPSVASQSQRGVEEGDNAGSAGAEGVEEFTGRSTEPATVRYERMKQRKKDTGQPFPPPAPPAAGPAMVQKPHTPIVHSGHPDTSVNVATAFREAMRRDAERGPVGGPSLLRRQEPVAQAEQEDEEQDDEEDGSGKETHVAGGAAGASASKKRKKRPAVKDPTFKPRAGETSESGGSDLGDGLSRGKAKRSKKDTSVEVVITAENGDAPPSTSKKSTASRRPRSGDAAYRPSATSDVSSEEDSEEGMTHRRRKSKGKGRASAGGSSQAIPIGRRDNEVWYGKKRKGRKGSRRPSGGEGGKDGEEEEEQDLGGMSHQDFTFDRSDEQQQQEDDDSTPAPEPTTFFLRPKSPPARRSVSPGAHSPFQPSRTQDRSPSTSVDPQIAAFDRSLGGASTSNSNSNDYSHSFNFSLAALEQRDRSGRSPSVDASILSVQNSYDYREEEEIVKALEAQKRASGGSLAGAGAGVGPSPSKSAAGSRRRMPGPPGGLQEMTIEEEGEGSRAGGAPAQEKQAGGAGGEFGSRLGKGVRPLWAGLGVCWNWARNPLLDWAKIGKAVGLLLLLVWALSALRSFAAPAPPPPNPARSWNPFTRSPPPPAFSAPSVPADSLTELVDRLTILEGAMGQLSTISESERTRSSSDRQLLAQVREQVGDLESGLAAERTRASNALAAGQQEGKKEAKELERTIKLVKGDLDSLVARVRGISDDRQADVVELRRLQSGVETVGKDIAALGTKVAQVSKDVQAGVDAERIARIALEAIEARLPSKLAVRMDDKGKLEIDPAFWRHLREAFAAKGDVERIVKTEVARLPKTSGSSSAPAQVIVKEPSWDEFLAANEVSLRTWVTSDLASRTGSDAIVSKKTFLDLVRREIKTLKDEFEVKANENVEKIGQEILSKVAKQEEMKRKDSLASHLNPFHRSHSASTGQQQQVTIKSSDGQNISAIISTLVDSALLRYSKDVLARPDYALYTAGARVIGSLTTPTYEPHPIGPSRRALAFFSGTHLPRGRPPVTALHPDNSPGSCWPFEGQQGQLGVQLSRRIVPSDVTLEHVSVDVAIDGEVASAPREFEVWGVVEGAEDVTKLAEFRREETEARVAAREAGATSEEDDLEAALATSLPPTPNHLLLVKGAYDTANPSPVQTFPVTSMARQLGIPVNTVVLRVLSNHGEKAFTCLYRVRVSGVTEEMRRRSMGEEAS